MGDGSSLIQHYPMATLGWFGGGWDLLYFCADSFDCWRHLRSEHWVLLGCWGRALWARRDTSEAHLWFQTGDLSLAKPESNVLWYTECFWRIRCKMGQGVVFHHRYLRHHSCLSFQFSQGERQKLQDYWAYKTKFHPSESSKNLI